MITKKKRLELRGQLRTLVKEQMEDNSLSITETEEGDFTIQATPDGRICLTLNIDEMSLYVIERLEEVTQDG